MTECLEHGKNRRVFRGGVGVVVKSKAEKKRDAGVNNIIRMT